MAAIEEAERVQKGETSGVDLWWRQNEKEDDQRGQGNDLFLRRCLGEMKENDEVLRTRLSFLKLGC